MADPVHYAGKVGYVVVDDGAGGSTEWDFGEWSFAMHAEFVKRNGFRSNGFQQGKSGFKSGKLTLRGPHEVGQAAPIEVGETYTFTLGISSDGPYEYSVDVHVTDVTPSNNAEGGPELEVSGDSVGEFGFATV